LTKDTSKPVLVTGATGYVAGWLVKRLLEEGYTVHAAVRDPNKKEKIAHLDKIAKNSSGNIKYFKSDLLEEGSYKDAMEACEVVFHTASPFVLDVNDPQKDLLEPAESGTANVLNTVNEVQSVKRVVVTSSCAAIYTDAIDTVNAPGGAINENIWNSTASKDYQPYSYSKYLAEKKAWEIAENQDRWKLVTINPSLVLGPPLNPKATTSESFNILKQMGDGTLKLGAPKLGIGMVDVRDVAEAHFQAAFNPNAKGRYITSAHNTNLFELAQELALKYGKDYPIPKSASPKWLVTLIGPLLNKSFTRKMIRNNVNIPWKADNSKIKNELGVKFRGMKETMEDSFQALIDAGIFKK
jgi:nucleoside-diphosphate-sugar epimerase